MQSQSEYQQLFLETEKLIIKFMCRCKQPRIAKAIFKQNSNTGKLIFPDFKIYNKARVIKTVWHWHKKNRDVIQNRRQETDLHVCGH